MGKFGQHISAEPVGAEGMLGARRLQHREEVALERIERPGRVGSEVRLAP